MDWYALVKKYYDRGYYSIEKVAVFVSSGKITEEQYTEITGLPYGGAANGN